MKKQLLALILVVTGSLTFAQAPTISGDTMLCPWDNGTASITSGQTYDTYQWYYKYWFLSDDFQAIDGANAASFTYDWYTYDQAIFKVVVTSGGNTYESNTIQIDSWNWVSMTISYEETEAFFFDPESFTYQLCDGSSADLSINNPPYNANIQWFKNDAVIDGANQSTYTVTGPGNYKVTAAPQMCPNSTSTSPTFEVQLNPNCQLEVGDNLRNEFRIYPIPAGDQVTIRANVQVFDHYAIYDLAGKKVGEGALEQTEQSISIAPFENGIYLVTLKGQNATATQKIIKQ